jgi:hypothetical protein
MERAFSLTLKGRLAKQLNAVNKGRIVIKFEDGKSLSYSNSTIESGRISIVIDVTSALNGTIKGDVQ